MHFLSIGSPFPNNIVCSFLFASLQVLYGRRTRPRALQRREAHARVNVHTVMYAKMHCLHP